MQLSIQLLAFDELSLNLLHMQSAFLPAEENGQRGIEKLGKIVQVLFASVSAISRLDQIDDPNVSAQIVETTTPLCTISVARHVFEIYNSRADFAVSVPIRVFRSRYLAQRKIMFKCWIGHLRVSSESA